MIIILQYIVTVVTGGSKGWGGNDVLQACFLYLGNNLPPPVIINAN